MKQNTRSLIALFLIFALVSLACGISIPGAGTIDSAATKVAATVNALAETAGAALTALPHDLPTLEVPGLPTLPPVEASPVRVSFTTPDGDLYTWTDGMAAPLLLDSAGNICCSYVSPDGSLIAYTRIGPDYYATSLEVINSDGTNQRIMLNAAALAALPRPADALGTEPRQVEWIPGSHTLAMNTRHYFEGPGLFMNENLYLVDADTAAVSTLLNTGQTTWQFVFSPDGTKLAVTYPTGMRTYNVDGSLIHDPVLVYPFINTASEYAWTAMPVWSPDNVELIARVPPEDPFFSPAAESSLWRVAADGLSGEQLFTGVMRYVISGESGVSPDLVWILFYQPTGPATDNTYQLVLGTTDGTSGVVVATGQVQGEPAWSPDSTRFLFNVGSLPTATAYIGDVSGASTPIADFSNAIDFKWMDANRYLAVTNDSHRMRLLLGTVGAPTGVLYDSITPVDGFIHFSINR